MTPRVIIITLNYNGYADTYECVKSLKMIRYDNFDIVVIDNASVDDSVKRLRNDFQNIVIIENKNNLGFGEGNNVGIEYALKQNCDYVLLINNDTIVDPNFLAELVKTAEDDPRIGVVGPKIFDYNNDKVSSCGGEIDWFRGIGFEYTNNNQNAKEYAFITGCCWLVRKEVFYGVGMFDARYFAYFEDLDFCKRVTNAGYKLVITPTSFIWHKVSTVLGSESYHSIYYKTRNRLLFMSGHSGIVRKSLFLLFFYPSRLVKIMLWLMCGKIKNAQALAAGIFDYYAKRFGGIPFKEN